MKRILPIVALLAAGAMSAHAEDAYNQAVVAVPVLKTTTTSIGQPIQYPATVKPEVTSLRVDIPPGKETGWHTHPVPGFAYVLAGTLTIELEGGKQLQFNAGQGFAEVVNTLHNGKNLGTEPVKLLVTFAGESGSPFAVKAPAPAPAK
ncbi:cupin domain-containing protein [Andreprevotia chitinilytica]|uniref:cupin domain-containing protein n=1 Tax=Andreprevotia chitinilytica TaxID=396808 RepID=UPI000691F3D8|nr:cupin domain-containing protein [Andreprevotia chitinilytica]